MQTSLFSDDLREYDILWIAILVQCVCLRGSTILKWGITLYPMLNVILFLRKCKTSTLNFWTLNLGKLTALHFTMLGFLLHLHVFWTYSVVLTLAMTKDKLFENKLRIVIFLIFLLNALILQYICWASTCFRRDTSKDEVTKSRSRCTVQISDFVLVWFCLVYSTWQ